MRISLHIMDKGNKQKFIFDGNYALETMLFKLTEIYYGKNIRIRFEDMLKTRITEGELNNGI